MKILRLYCPLAYTQIVILGPRLELYFMVTRFEVQSKWLKEELDKTKKIHGSILRELKKDPTIKN